MQFWTPHDISWKGSEHYQYHHSPNTEGVSEHAFMNSDIAEVVLVVIVYISHL